MAITDGVLRVMFLAYCPWGLCHLAVVPFVVCRCIFYTSLSVRPLLPSPHIHVASEISGGALWREGDYPEALFVALGDHADTRPLGGARSGRMPALCLI